MPLSIDPLPLLPQNLYTLSAWDDSLASGSSDAPLLDATPVLNSAGARYSPLLFGLPSSQPSASGNTTDAYQLWNLIATAITGHYRIFNEGWGPGFPLCYNASMNPALAGTMEMGCNDSAITWALRQWDDESWQITNTVLNLSLAAGDTTHSSILEPAEDDVSTFRWVLERSNTMLGPSTESGMSSTSGTTNSTGSSTSPQTPGAPPLAMPAPSLGVSTNAAIGAGVGTALGILLLGCCGLVLLRRRDARGMKRRVEKRAKPQEVHGDALIELQGSKNWPPEMASEVMREMES